MPFLPDTNVWISLLKNPGGKLAVKVQAQSISDVFLCSVVKAELWHGAEKYGNRERRKRALELLFAPFASLPFDDAAARHYADIRHQLEVQGRIIEEQVSSLLTLVSGGFLFSGSASMRPGLWRCRRPRAVRRAGGGRGRCGYAARLARPAIADGIRRLPGKTTPGALRPPARLSRGSPRSGIFSNSIINAVMLVSNSDVASHVAHRSRFLIRGSPFQYTPLLQDCFGLKGPTWQSSCSLNRRICSSGSQVS